MTKPRSIAVFSASRADLWPLTPVLAALAQDPRCKVTLLAGGDHALAARNDLAQADLDGVEVVLVNSAATGGRTDELAEATARGLIHASAYFAAHRPDLLVVLGDRYELLGPVTAAVVHRVPIAHLHGGEITEGALDDAVRHAMTKLSHVHLCATRLAAARVRAMGEEPWRVHVTGAPSIDRLIGEADAAGLAVLAELLGPHPRRPIALLTYHPPTLAPGLAADEFDAIVAALETVPTVVATEPGRDPGAAAVTDRLHEWAGGREGVIVAPSLGRAYPALLQQADLMIGNSSSGLIEAPTFGLPVVNVGDRQKGRERAASVIDAPGDAASVVAAVTRGLDPRFRASVQDAVNPYGDGRAAARIAEALLGAPLDQLLHKRWCGPVQP